MAIVIMLHEHMTGTYFRSKGYVTSSTVYYNQLKLKKQALVKFTLALTRHVVLSEHHTFSQPPFLHSTY